MGFGFTESNADAQDGAFALGVNAQGDEDGAIQELAPVADLFVAGIEHQVGKGLQRAGAPGLELSIELGGALTHPASPDGGAAELLDDGGDFAGGDALDIHFGQGQLEGLLAPHPFFQGAGIEFQAAPDLRDLELDGADTGVEGFGFEAIGMASAGFGAFVGLGLESLGAFLAHGFVDQQADAGGQAAAGALLSQELQNGVQEFRIGSVGRHGFALDVFGDTPTGNHYGPPSTSFWRRQPPFGGGCAPARYARLRSAAPEGGLGGRKKSNLQNYVYTSFVVALYSGVYAEYMPSLWPCGGF